MRRYIDITDIEIPSEENNYDELVEFADAIAEQEIIQLPERKKGQWIVKERFVNSPEFYSWQCSVCGCVLEDPTLDKPYPFCPNCGADMRGEQDEIDNCY